jgi:hypothetical protein|tara:strand:- start:325 stop:573 length:249 start_codon:yes stop_codon:yes gene_type:complete
MEISPLIFWNVILTVVVGPLVWLLKSLLTDVRNVETQLSKIREEYATRAELKDDMKSVLDALIRLETKLDRALLLAASLPKQ